MKKIALLVALVLVAGSCGGRQQVAERRELKPRPLTLPDPIRALPAFRLTFSKTPHRQVVDRLLKIRGVAVAVPIDKGSVMVKAGDRKARLRVGSASALLYRAIAPSVTAQAEFVWSSLLQGEAVLTPETASRLGMTGASAVEIKGRTFTVGAFADNGVPNIADVLLSDHVAKKLDLRPAAIVVGAKPKHSLERMRAAIRSEVPAARLHRLQPRPDPPAPEPVGTAEGGLIGAMTFRIRKNGFIEPDPAWVSANIVEADVPVLGHVMCHRLVIPQLGAALAEIERKR
ncbi:MAG TPA: hypothetical protein VNP73_02980, partial [Actinomycetota bacterium]|nr:hypothetical protein [Actinomycetota bacterium]